jgi:hypothetical protein
MSHGAHILQMKKLKRKRDGGGGAGEGALLSGREISTQFWTVLPSRTYQHLPFPGPQEPSSEIPRPSRPMGGCFLQFLESCDLHESRTLHANERTATPTPSLGALAEGAAVHLWGCAGAGAAIVGTVEEGKPLFTDEKLKPGRSCE